MGEVGGGAVDDADAGALLGARLDRLDPRLVDRHRQPAAPFGEDLGEAAAVGEGAGEDAGGEVLVEQLGHDASFRALWYQARLRGQVDHRVGGDEQLGARGRVGRVLGGAAAGVVETGEGLALDAAAAHVGGGLVGVAGDAVEEDAVRLRRHQPASPSASSRRAERMSKKISEASAKRSVTATAAKPCVAQGEDLAGLGGDVDLLDRLVAGGVGDARAARPPRRPTRRRRRRRRGRCRRRSRIAPPRRSGDISVRKESAASAAAGAGAVATASGT